MRPIFAIALLALAGCEMTPLAAVSYQERNALIMQILDRCHKAGAKADTPEERVCFAQEVRAEQYRRDHNAAAIAAVGRGLQAAAAIQASQPAPAFSPVYTGPQQTVIVAPQPTLSQTVNSMRRTQR